VKGQSVLGSKKVTDAPAIIKKKKTSREMRTGKNSRVVALISQEQDFRRESGKRNYYRKYNKKHVDLFQAYGYYTPKNLKKQIARDDKLAPKPRPAAIRPVDVKCRNQSKFYQAYNPSSNR